MRNCLAFKFLLLKHRQKTWQFQLGPGVASQAPRKSGKPGTDPFFVLEQDKDQGSPPQEYQCSITLELQPTLSVLLLVSVHQALPWGCISSAASWSPHQSVEVVDPDTDKRTCKSAREPGSENQWTDILPCSLNIATSFRNQTLLFLGHWPLQDTQAFSSKSRENVQTIPIQLFGELKGSNVQSNRNL